MNLTEDEARELFPDGRGVDVDDADVVEVVRIERVDNGGLGDEDAFVVTVDDTVCRYEDPSMTVSDVLEDVLMADEPDADAGSSE